DDDSECIIHRAARSRAADHGGRQSPQFLSASGPYSRVAPMAARALGFSSDDRSPGSLPVYTERTPRRRILALRVLGRSPTKWIAFGRSGLPRASATRFCS